MNIKLGMKLLVNDRKRLLIALNKYELYKFIPDKPFLMFYYRLLTGNKLDLHHPVGFNQKLQWLKIHDRNRIYTTLVDKYAVREYIAETIGKQYLVPLMGVYEHVGDIDWEALPDEFVLKCTHGSGCNIICADKSKLDVEASKIKLEKWMKKNWYWVGREWPYKNVKPKIICEQFISNNNKPPEDYKVLCFNGKAKLIEVHLNRFGEQHECDNYDMNWEKTNISQKCVGLPNSSQLIPKPVVFDQMISMSEALAGATRHVRIDWYIVENKLYFGEITFYDASGFSDFDREEDDYLLGSWISL